MSLKLAARAVDKPWGRIDLPALFPNPRKRRVGEIWFEASGDSRLPLLVKYIFTSERLSIQVHPNDAQAIPYGLPSGKEECWYILDCEPGATIGIGLKQSLPEAAVRAAIADGTIEQLIDWKPIEPGDFFFIPAGTIHAIGAGISLVEIQQNSDITFRLYDYGRPRALHVDQGLEVSRLAPYEADRLHLNVGQTRTLLTESSAPFEVDMVSWSAGQSVQPGGSAQCWFIPVVGEGSIDGQHFQPGECWLAGADAVIDGARAGSALMAHSSQRVDHED